MASWNVIVKQTATTTDTLSQMVTQSAEALCAQEVNNQHLSQAMHIFQ